MKQKLLIFFLFGLFALPSVYAQNRKITGTVTGADDGQPLPGVSVMVQGTKIGTLTGGDGEYTLNVPSGGGTLVFTFIGYTTQQINITSGNTFNVKIASSTRQLSEVVIQSAYGSQAKKSYTGAAATVSGTENENKPFSSVQQALQGEVAGLNASSFSGQPGANVQIRIRGINSVTADSNPLYVIDGMIINSGDLSRLGTTNGTNVLSGINDDDIESITVLKDAAATAIYGSRGSNGVIVITTKRGKSGKTTVRFDAESGVSNNLPLPDAGKPLTGDQYATLFKEALTNANYPAATIATLATSYGLNGRSNNWYDLVTNRGTQQQYNVSISGGTDKTKVFASAGYFKQQATTLASSLTRGTGLLNIDHQISKRFNLSTGLNVSNVQQIIPPDGGAFASPVLSAYFLRPFQLAYNDDGSLNTSRTGNSNFTSVYNPLFLAQADSRTANQTRALGNATLKWDIWDELKFTSYISGDYNLLEENQYNNPTMGDGRTVNGRAYAYYTRYFNWLARNQLSYRYKIPGIEDFFVDASAGYEAQKSVGYFISAAGTGYPLTQPSLTALANTSTPTTASASFSDYTFNSIYAQASANYKNRYSLSGSFRRDGSSRFGANNKFGKFYSVGGAWNIDQEDFFRQQTTLTTTKIRASYGTTGNAGIGNYIAQQTSGYGYNYNGANGQQYNTVGNPSLTWESAKKFDVGADIGFFKDRLFLSADYYINNIDQLLFPVQVSRTTGFTSVTENVGTMQNKGLELSVKGIPVRVKDFTWSTSFNIAFNKNKITNLDVNSIGQNGYYYLGKNTDYYAYYTKLSAGVDPANGNALWYTDGSKSLTTSNYSAASYVINGKQADPKYFGGFNNSFNYKNIILSTDFYYNFGNYIADTWSYYLNDGTSITSYNKYQSTYTDRWTTPGQITDVPKVVYGGTNSGQSSSFSDRFLYRGDYIRLKNLTIGYDFKSIPFLKQLGLSKLYLYGRGTNIWTKTYDKRLPFDPEVGINGQSNLEVPQIKTFTIGLNVGL
ncbi:MAG: SusC/RagA family TonB-linked outer membrane protein [Janthinobacterium lividum]